MGSNMQYQRRFPGYSTLQLAVLVGAAALFGCEASEDAFTHGHADADAHAGADGSDGRDDDAEAAPQTDGAELDGEPVEQDAAPPEEAAPPPIIPSDGSVAADQDAAIAAEALPPPGPAVAISEVMYHPVLANDDDNNHEFVELHNPGPQPVAIAGWKLQGEVRFTFPEGSTIGAGQYLVVARSRARLLEVPAYGLGTMAGSVLGDYTGALDNGGGRVTLVDAAGATVDEVRYDDAFPWPLAADAFGAGEGWFEEPQWFAATDPRRNLAAHRYLGHSLERVSFTRPAAEVANWVASPLDGASPGRANTRSGTPPAIVEQLTVTTASGAAVLHAGEPLLVRAALTPQSPVSNVQLEYYLEYEGGKRVATTPPGEIKVAMTPGPAGYEAALPALPARTLVRYRISAERTPGAPEVLSPRPTDPVPYGRHAIYVPPAIAGKPYYEILISPESWGQLWTNISPDGAVLGCPSDYDEWCTRCEENPRWNGRVPAVFIFAGEAYDVRARYQGSMEGRTGAQEIKEWPADLPRPSTGPINAMSWSLSLPRYRRFEHMSSLVLNRLYQSCPGISHALAAELLEDVRGGRTPAPHVRRWARVFVNGGAYNYMMDLEPIGEGYLERFHGKGKPIGDAFKLFSTGSDYGPWAAGFGQVIRPSESCPAIPLKTRYEKTYKRETNDWRSTDEVIALIDGLGAAVEEGVPQTRAFLQKNFDVDTTLKYYAVANWGAAWDDTSKNYNIYKLPPQAVTAGSGPFTITSWDVDRMFGVAWCKTDAACARADIAIHCDPDLPRCNRWKRAFLDAFRPEYDAKMKELNETVLQPAHMKQLIDQISASYDIAEAQQMLVEPTCDAAEEIAGMKRFADRRYLAVKQRLGY
jgi:hypothetical protein